LGNTSVLEFYVTKTVETFLVSVVKKSKRIVESKWLLCSKLRLESLKRPSFKSVLSSLTTDVLP